MKDYNKIKLIVILIIASLIFSLFTLFVAGENKPSLSARSAVLYNMNEGSFLYTKNESQRLPMASTTKIMTALIAIEQLDMNESLLVPKEATGIEGSSVYLRENDFVTVGDLVYSVLLQSANDAATVLALKIGGDIYGFSEIMNKRAEEIGLLDTNFENPHGLDSKNHYTTAHDLALLAAEALKNPTFKKICSTYKHDFFIGDGRRVVVNHNKLLKRYKGAIGVKTGYTKKSGRCLVGACERDGVILVTVTLNAPNDWQDHEKLFDYGYSVIDINKKEKEAI